MTILRKLKGPVARVKEKHGLDAKEQWGLPSLNDSEGSCLIVLLT